MRSAHAIESYVSKIATPFTELQSLQAIRLIFEHLEAALETRSLDCLQQLSTASTAAAMAFSNAGLGADHALAHSLGGMFDTLHGLVHPVLLPPVMRFNLRECVEKMANIGEVILNKKIRPREAMALAGIEKLSEYCESLQVNNHLREIVDDPRQLPELCKMALNDACLLTNPRAASAEDLLRICEEAW